MTKESVKDTVVDTAKDTVAATGHGIRTGLFYAAAILTTGLILLGVKKATGYNPLDSLRS